MNHAAQLVCTQKPCFPRVPRSARSRTDLSAVAFSRSVPKGAPMGIEGTARCCSGRFGERSAVSESQEPATRVTLAGSWKVLRRTAQTRWVLISTEREGDIRANTRRKLDAAY
jgi:hypothetical protein